MVSQESLRAEIIQATKRVYENWVRLFDNRLQAVMTGGLEERIEAIVDFCQQLASVDAVCIYWLPETEWQTAEGGGAHAFKTPIVDASSADMTFPDHKLVTQIAAAGRPCYLDGASKEWPPKGGFTGLPRLTRAVYLIPLGPGERVVAVLCAGTFAGGGIPKETRCLLEVFAPCFALAIENARLRSAVLGMPPQADEHSPADQGNAGPLEVGTVARIAHDLKNSMTSVSTFMQLLPKKWSDTAFRSSFYPVARDEALRVNHLVNDLLDHGKERFARHAPVDMRAVLAHILPLKAPLADQRRLRVRVRDGATLSTIRIDRRAIEEAVVNLLSNAMEASPDGGAIDIRLEDDLLPSGQPGIRLEIQDGGPGVDQAMREAIFAPYVSTKSDDLSAGGTGLGLSIARQHIEAHGGTIAVENPAEGGALFRIRLPLERRRANRQAH